MEKEIRDQIYDEKANKVTISVVCCNPEKFRDKLCCKGCKVIKSIDIKEPPKPKEPEKPKQPEKPKEPEKPKQPEKPKEPEKPKQPEKPKEPEKPKQPEKPKEKPKEVPKPDTPKPPPPAPAPAPPPPGVVGCPPDYPVPVRTCCRECYEGYGGGPCYHGYGVPPPPPPCYDGYYGYGCGPRRGCYVSRCDYYLSEENPHSCSIM